MSVDFERGARFEGRPVHDTLEKTWRHLNFFKYPCFVHARVPRVEMEDGSVKMVQVPLGSSGEWFNDGF